MQTLYPNSRNIIMRFVMLILLITLLYIIILKGLTEFHNTAAYLLYLMIVVDVCLFVIIIITLVASIKIQMQDEPSQIILQGIFFRKNIMMADIKAYHLTKKIAGTQPYLGILLILTHGKSIQLDERNIKSVTDLKKYLDENSVTNLGERKPKFPFNW